MASPKALTQYTTQQVSNMTTPSRLYGKYFECVADADNRVDFPVEAHKVEIYCADPIWIAFASGVSNADPDEDEEDRVFFEGGGRYSFVVGTALTGFLVSNFTPSDAPVLYITLGD